VLRRADAAQLLPFLAEPLQYAVEALSVQRRGVGVTTFLGILREVAFALTNTKPALATLAADSAAAFVVDADATNAVLAVDTLLGALGALSKCTPQDDGSHPLLPAVHVYWPSLLAAVTHGCPSAALAALAAIPEIAVLCGGDFLRERVRDLPLHRLLSPHDGGSSRLQLATLRCLHDLAADPRSRPSLEAVTLDAAELVLALLPDRALPDSCDLAQALLSLLAEIEPDAIWLMRSSSKAPKRPASTWFEEEDNALFA